MADFGDVMMSTRKIVASLFIALLAMVGGVEATENPATAALDSVASDDIQVPDDPPSVCDRDFGTAPISLWFTQLIHSLCKRGDADSLLAAYLITAPPFGTRAEADRGLLGRAYAIGKNNPNVLWAVVFDIDCRPYIECRKNRRDVVAAQELTRIDPDNAMAWFALAYAEGNYLSTPDRSAVALKRAAQAPLVHDYGFDLLKLAAAATGRIPIPKVALANDARPPSPPELVRWTFTYTTADMSTLLSDWIHEDCHARDLEDASERLRQCAAAKSQFKRGDSLLTLSEDPAAGVSVPAELKLRPAGIGNPNWISDEDYARAIIPAIAASSNERKMYTTLMVRLGRK